MKNICSVCLEEIETIDMGQYTVSLCDCDAPSNYINVCWNCHADIDSSKCKRSATPNMGYHCNVCGEDLTKWMAKLH